MKSTVSFINRTNNAMPELPELKKLVKYALKKEKINNAEFGVIFVNNDEIQRINNEYRHIDRVTDVISFALEDNDDFIFEDYRLLGDIYISLDRASEQAIEYGHSYLRELSFLMIHGFLHLLGYDHQNEDDEKIMFHEQEEILNGYGIKK